MLSPTQLAFKTFRDAMRADGIRHGIVASPDLDSDHPMIKEIRRRLVQIVRDCVQLNIL